MSLVCCDSFLILVSRLLFLIHLLSILNHILLLSCCSSVRQRCALAPSFFKTSKVVYQSCCRSCVDNIEVFHLVYADDDVILVESLEDLVLALRVLYREAKPLGLKVSWANSKLQSCGGLLDDTVHSVQACGEGVKIAKSSTYLYT